MSKYRICENKYGWHKIQKCQKEIKILGITFRKKRVDELIEQDKKLNNEWTCI
jgi:hypothetical protein